jgi:hypothetical protein
MITFCFNTGRRYADDDQPISAILHADGKTIDFADHARGIDGRIVLDQEIIVAGVANIARVVMEHYDAGKYRDIPIGSPAWPGLSRGTRHFFSVPL